MKRNMEFLKKDTYIRAIEELNKQLTENAQIEYKDVKYYVEGNILSTYLTIEAIEDIGEKQIINTN